MLILPTTISSLLYEFCSEKRKFVLAQLSETTLLHGVIYIIIIIAGQNRQVNRGHGITMLQLLGPHPNLIVHRGDETIFHC